MRRMIPTRSLRGTETVLVAEDEDGVRELLRKALTEYGYTALTARHGRDALMIAGERQGGIDLLLTDIVMPEMSGRELAETLLDHEPDLKVLYISGYTDDEVLQRGVRGREVPLMRKPFATEELGAAGAERPGRPLSAAVRARAQRTRGR